MIRRSRSGQSILIVAFAFILLIAFVGIAVDVGLLFVRYSALRRAVDAASIAAAQQIREDTDYATLHAVATQYIKLQGGIEADTVRVETCETEIYDLMIKYPAIYDTVEKALNEIYQRIPPSELCKREPQKLVRVSAQMRSPTAFLQVVGWPTVLLEASAVSQTALLDVALVIDTSISMAFDTSDAMANPIYGSAPNQDSLKSFQDFMVPLNLRAYEDRTSGARNHTGLTNGGEPAIRYECWRLPILDFGNDAITGRPIYEFAIEAGTRNGNYSWGACCNDPTTQSNPDGTVPDRANLLPPDSNNRTSDYRSVTNVHFWEVPVFQDPAANPPWLDGESYDPDWYVSDDGKAAESKIGTVGGMGLTGKATARVVSGEPDGNYSDLICQPFKQVRDAARRFIKRLDFVRGDRLVMVTFNDRVDLVTPFNPLTDKNQVLPVITDKNIAIRTLNERVGVTVNPAGMERGCLTQAYWTGTSTYPVNQYGYFSYWTVSQCTDTNMGGGIQYARAALTDARWIRRDAVWVMVLLSDGYPNRTPSYDNLNLGMGTPVGGDSRNNLMIPPEIRDLPIGDDIRWYCDLNYGGPYVPHPKYGSRPWLCTPPLWTGSDAFGTRNHWGLYDPVTTGPIYSFGFCPWNTFCDTSRIHEDDRVYCQEVGSDDDPMWYETDTKQGRWSPVRAGANFSEPLIPYCVDWNPDTRHFCKDDKGVINATGAYCDPRYDPDDFMRDQADFSGLLDYTIRTKGNFIAMYSIFFNPDGGNINADILGVKALRYIADAGDNGEIDNRLQAWFRLRHNNRMDPTSPEYGPLDPIAQPPKIGRFYLPGKDPFYDETGLRPNDDPCAAYDYSNYSDVAGADYLPAGGQFESILKKNCGQYFYADTIAAVNDAFQEIARRLFTRLAR